METSPESTGPTLFDPTLYAAATPANPSAPQENAAENTTHATSGPTSETPLATYDPATQSWKTSEDISLWGDCPSLAKLPPSGIARNGELLARPPWEPITAAIGSSLLHTPTSKMNQMSPSMANGKRLSGWWPTPTAVTRPMEGNVRLYRAKIKAGEMTEEEATAISGKSPYEPQGKIPAMWPTPTTQEVEHPDAILNEKGRRVSKDGKNSHSLGLADAVQIWRTPTVDDSKNVNPKDNRYLGLVAQVNSMTTEGTNGGKLNPMWVEWLMGFPLGWTDLKDSETPSSPK